MTARVHVTAATAAAFGVSKAKRGHKYRAVACEVDGHRFPSKAEARRYSELKVMRDAGLIRDLVLQPRYPFYVNGVAVGSYVGDFAYRDDEGRTICDDTKGMMTDLFRLKIKLAKALYPSVRFLINGEPYKT